MNGQLGQYGQTNAIEQYPQSGFRMPQLDALRRARAGGAKPLYAGSADVMGEKPGMTPQVGSEGFNDRGGPKPLEDRMGGMGTPMSKPGMGATPMEKPGMRSTDRIRQNPELMFGRPNGRSMPGIPQPPSVINVRERY